MRGYWWILASVLLASAGQAEEYQKAVEGTDLVKNKIYPHKQTIEPSLNAGAILNQSYVDTFLLNGGLIYNLSEEWGVGADFSLGLNSDKAERFCIEHFYNDPDEKVGAPCQEEGQPDDLGQDPKGHANFGPAYVPIRELQYVATVNAVWTPVYGKQLFLMSATSFFDLFVEAGLGLAISKFYGEQHRLANGNESRGAFNADGSQPNPPIGASARETASYGVEGRPEALNQTNVLVNLGIGQKFHFFKKGHAKISLRNMTLLGTPSSFENLFVLYVGLGLRF